MYNKPMNLDTLVRNTVGVHPSATMEPNAFGLEVELEGIRIRTTRDSVRAFWGLHEDGSLRAQILGRHGAKGETAEYVSLQPYSAKATLDSLKALFDYLNSPGVIVFPSYRTSIHVHVNCAMETWRTVYNYITLAIIFDELFVSQNGTHRIGNNFCLRFLDAEAPIHELSNYIKIHGSINGFSQNMRYGSVNVAALSKFGTIEFRSMECNTDLSRVWSWVQTLQKLKESAREFQTPVDIISLFSQYSPEEFAKRILGEHFFPYSLVPDFGKMLIRGMRLAQDFAYSATWEAKRAVALKIKKSRNLGQAVLEALGDNMPPVPQDYVVLEFNEDDVEDEE